MDVDAFGLRLEQDARAIAAKHKPNTTSGRCVLCGRGGARHKVYRMRLATYAMLLWGGCETGKAHRACLMRAENRCNAPRRDQEVS